VQTAFFQTEPNQTHSEPNPSFFQKPNRNQTKILKIIPCIPICENGGSVMAVMVMCLSCAGSLCTSVWRAGWQDIIKSRSVRRHPRTRQHKAIHPGSILLRTL